MDVYKLKNHSLKQFESNPFALEREIQNLVEANLEEIFGLELVASELSVGDYRLDTLAFDRESSCFVIIEYKKGHSYSVIDQGYSYLSTMLQNKADFILEYIEAKKDTLRKNDVDWGASRIIFVAPSFNSYQKNSINFKDVPFELWEIKRFSDDTIVLNQHRATSKESIIAPPIQDTQKLSSDNKKLSVKTHSVDEILSKTSPECRDVWNAISEYFDNLEDTRIKINRDYISILKGKKAVCHNYFQRGQILIEVTRGTKKLDGSLSKGFFTLKDPDGLATDNEWTWKDGNKGNVYKIKVKDTLNIDYLFYLLKQKYDAI